MSMFADREALANNVVAAFEAFTPEEQNVVLRQILLKCQPLQLRFVYAELKTLLAVDFVAHLPRELTERIFSYLDGVEMSRAACVSRLWREKTNNEGLWQRLCKLKRWEHFGFNEDLSREESCSSPTATSRTSPRFTPVNSDVISLSPLCCWKDVYIRAHHLNKNWATGKYTVMPALRGHDGRVNCIDCDGKLLVSGGGDNCVRLWDLATGKCINQLEGHTDSVTGIQLRNNIVVTSCADSVIRVFEASSGRCLKVMQGHTAGVEHLCFDGANLVSASNDRTVRVWSLSSGKCIHNLTGHTDDIQLLCMHGDLAVSSSWDQTLRLWDIRRGLCLQILVGHAEVVYCCQFDERRVVSGGADSFVKIWNPQTGDCTKTLTGHTGEVYCLKYNEDIIASGAADSIVRLWSFAGECLHELREHIGVVRCLLLEGDRLISGGDQKKVVIWNAKEGKLLNVVHRNPTLLHLMWANETKLVLASPESPGTVSILSYW
ncbi:uncharacterized protein LOC144911555 [Branchiostoma floridae x Branchiostoma belcheri]